jgi:hypothetical protein
MGQHHVRSRLQWSASPNDRTHYSIIGCASTWRTMHSSKGLERNFHDQTCPIIADRTRPSVRSSPRLHCLATSLAPDAPTVFPARPVQPLRQRPMLATFSAAPRHMTGHVRCHRAPRHVTPMTTSSSPFSTPLLPTCQTQSVSPLYTCVSIF